MLEAVDEARDHRVIGRRLGRDHTRRGQGRGGRERHDVSGAGDTVIATIGVLLGAGAPLPAAVRIANEAAGIVVGKLGTAVVTPDELR